MTDIDQQLMTAIETTTADLDAARETIRAMANELSDVIDVIEPALADQAARLRRARMSSLDEMRLISTALVDLRDTFLAPRTATAIHEAERFLAVMKELEEFRACGALEAFMQVFGVVHGA